MTQPLFARRSLVPGIGQGYRGNSAAHLGYVRRLTRWIFIMGIGLAFLNTDGAYAISGPMMPRPQGQERDNTPSGIKVLAEAAKQFGNAYVDVERAYDIAKALLQVMGVLREDGVDLEAQFAGLHSDLNRIYTYLEASDAAKDWRDRKDDQNRRFSMALTAVERAGQAVLSMPPIPISLGSPSCEASRLCSNAAERIMQDSHFAVTEAKRPEEFQRYYRLAPCSAGTIRGTNRRCDESDLGKDGDRNENEWSRMVEDSAAQELQHFYGYDWRSGVPHLMQLIAMRLQVIAAYNFYFKEDYAFQSELLGHREALLDNYEKMIKGVKSGWDYSLINLPQTDEYGHTVLAPSGDFNLRMGCVDVYTGTHIVEFVKLSDIDPTVLSDIDRTMTNPYYPSITRLVEEETRRRLDRLCDEIMRKMPLFEMRSLIDTLYLYAYPGLAARSGAHRIAVAARPDLCLTAESGTPVSVSRCDGSEMQRWAYDRPSGMIRNQTNNQCLGVEENSAPGAPVWISECTGGETQMWTHDPETEVFQNALGTVLSIPDSGVDEPQPVSTSYRDDGPAQRWRLVFIHPRLSKCPTDMIGQPSCPDAGILSQHW